MSLSITLIGLAYLAGSLSSAILLCRLCNVTDPRQEGSGNPGATNVLRLHGKRMAAAVLLGDISKGVVPVLLAQALGRPEWCVALAGLATFLGHLHPIFFRFRGGKGVATLLGVLLAGHYSLGGIFIASWLAVFLIFRYASLAAILAGLTVPLWGLWWLLLPVWPWPACCTVMGLWLTWCHRSNIRRLLADKEPRTSLFS